MDYLYFLCRCQRRRRQILFGHLLEAILDGFGGCLLLDDRGREETGDEMADDLTAVRRTGVVL